MLKNIFIKKDAEQLLRESESSKLKLKRVLTKWDLVAFGIGSVVGAGIFTVIGTAAAGTVDSAGNVLRAGAGPALIISFIIAGLACGFSTLCYAEFASIIPISGSAYTYSYVILGEFIAWIIGWDLILEYSVAVIAVSVSWSAYAVSLLKGFGINLPIWLSLDYKTFLHKINADPSILEQVTMIFGHPLSVNLPAILIVTIITIVLVIGIRESSLINTIMVIVKMGILIFFIALGIFFIKPVNFSLPEYGFLPFGWSGVMTGSALIFFAYIGFDAITTVAEETKNPKKDMPFGIIGAMIITTLFYIIVSVILMGVVPFHELGRADPISYAFKYIDMGWASGIVSIGALIATTSVILVTLLGQTRIFFSISRDGLLPSAFSKVHKRFKTPYISTIITGIFVAVIAGFIDIGEAAELTNIGTLFAFAIVCLSVIILRIKDPDKPRPFKTPFFPYVPILGILSCLYLSINLPALTWYRFAFWLIAGILIYVFYGYKNSRARNL